MSNNNKRYSIGSILRYDQDELVSLVNSLVSKPKLIGNGYTVIGRGSKPKPMLCVHLDTINTHSKQTSLHEHDISYNVAQNRLHLTDNSVATCLGGDDRAGVWIAIQMIFDMLPETEWAYDIGFFTDEEIGCIGSGDYREYLREYAPDNINTTCYIGLDRRSGNGLQEIATYGDDNRELIEAFVSYGYKEVCGSITDASMLSGEVACVNLSVGYDNEHTKHEVLYLQCMQDTLSVLKGITLEDKYYEVEYTDGGSYPWEHGYEDDDITTMHYVYELEDENTKLRDMLEAMGIDVDSVLKEMM